MTSRIDSVPASSDTMRSHPKAMPPCGRRAVGEGLEQEAELLLRVLLRQAHHPEDPLLHVAAVDTDRPAADLVAVADDVVGVGERRAGVGVEGVEELGLGRGEGVVHRGPGAGTDGDVTRGDRVGGRLEERGVDDPEEAPGGLVDEVAAACRSRGARPRAARARAWPPRPRRRCSHRARRRRAAARPARSASVRFLATGPPSSPSSWTST